MLKTTGISVLMVANLRYVLLYWLGYLGSSFETSLPVICISDEIVRNVYAKFEQQESCGDLVKSAL